MMPAGRLQLTLPNGEIIERHGERAGPDAIDRRASLAGALRRMMLDGEHGFSDAYLDGDWSTPELSQLLEFCVHNEAALTETAASGWLGLVAQSHLALAARQHAARQPAQHRRALRSRQRVLPPLARCRHELFVSTLCELRHAGTGAGRQARSRRKPARSQRRRARTRDRLRLGRVRGTADPPLWRKRVRHHAFGGATRLCAHPPCRRNRGRPRRPAPLGLPRRPPGCSTASRRSR